MNKDLKKSIKKPKKIKKIKPKKEISKKKKIFNIVFYSVCSLVIVGSVSYLIYYFVDENKDNSWDGASEYISKRTLALQFAFQDSTGSGAKYVGGTGWIINKESDSNTYYIATNLHVASALTYENKEIYSYESNSWTSYGSIVQSLVGYVNSDIGKGSSSSSDNTKMITVAKPTVVYKPSDDSNWNYPKLYGLSPKDFNDGKTEYSTTADFAILKYNFSSNDLLNQHINSDNNSILNSQTQVNDFANWLKSGYDSNPTKFLNKSIQEVDNWQNLKYSMGGFPGNTGTNYGITSSNLNYLHQSWESYSNFTLENNRINNYGTAGDLYRDASNGTYTDPIVWAKDNAQNSSGNKYSSGYINVAYKGILSSHSRNGSSGSMLITYLDNEAYVVGIYWGITQFGSSSGENLDLGTADFFYTNSNGSFGNTNYSGYNLIQWSYSYLATNNAKLFFDPTKNQINN